MPRTQKRTGSTRNAPASPMTLKEAVRWLLRFAEQDVATLPDPECVTLCLDLYRFIGKYDKASVEIGENMRRRLAQGEPRLRRHIEDVLLECQREATQGLTRFFDGRGWTYHVALSGSMHRAGGRIVWAEDKEGVTSQVFAFCGVLLIREIGSALKQCPRPECGRRFVSEGRQAYCTRLCSDRVRVAKFRKGLEGDPKRKEKALARRRAAYKKRARAKVWARP